MAALARRLADSSEGLAGLRAARAHMDRSIAETEAACAEGRFGPRKGSSVVGNDQAPQGNGHGPEAARAPGVFGQRFGVQAEIVKVSVQNQELDWMVLVGPSQLCLFCDV
ncbi:hypothetical protein WISP_19646 [Willisornis vidua]|uniref:Uncharacterized protein n=1 Tax=Willisornis vidua TaxID=1566151 RepID=A0ABQ9DPH4_9PASS|nr:hypothetical protein WISP_19646 [Willisornis vidua]